MSTLASLQGRPIQRLRVQGLLAVSSQLVRGAARRTEPRVLRQLMLERRRLLRELGNGIREAHELGCFEAMRAAVVESDRALLRIMKDQRACTRA